MKLGAIIFWACVVGVTGCSKKEKPCIVPTNALDFNSPHAGGMTVTPNGDFIHYLCPSRFEIWSREGLSRRGAVVLLA